jgi:hypothetical protein
MPTYKIKVEYETGDSFGRQDTSTILEMEWKTLAFAKVALARIREHYDWYSYQNCYRRFGRDKGPAEPEWHKGLDCSESLILVLDNGNEVKFWPPWCGYFERLYGASIILPEEEGMSFSV